MDKNNDTPEVRENEGIPAVNKEVTSSKLKTIIGFIVILLVGLGGLLLVNISHKPVKKNTPSNEEVKNTLPKIAIPAPPPVIQTAPPPNPADTNKSGQNTAIVSPVPANGKGKVLDWTDRKMGGGMIVSIANTPGKNLNGNTNKEAAAAAKIAALSKNISPANSASNGLSEKLVPSQMVAAVAAQLPDRNYLITKGTSLDCALETALDSTVPGLTTCRLTRDVYSDNGQVLLLDRGSKMVGEYQGGIKNGQARLFVLWTRAETPNGVIINLDSPGTDALGRSGLEGWVDNHFIDRFGAAIMMSMIQSSMQMATNSASSGTTNYYGNASSDGGRVIEKILDSTVNIPPTLIKNQGDHIAIMVARDLDFRGVYSLKTK